STATFVSADNAARIGDALLIFSTGLGQTTPALRTGAIVSDALNNATGAVSVVIGDRTLPALLSIAAPGLPGVYVTGVILPPDIARADQKPWLAAGGVSSTTVMLPIM